MILAALAQLHSGSALSTDGLRGMPTPEWYVGKRFTLGAGVDRRAAEHTAQTIHHRLTTTRCRSQRPDTLVNALNASAPSSFFEQCDTLTRYHRPCAALALPGCCRRLYAWIIQKPQQVATVICQPSSF